MKNTPTWMAGQAKFVAVYETPFWRKKGLSGDGVSEIGPLGEIHDACASIGAPHALFGFVGLPASARTGHDQDIIQAATEQLSRMFGSGEEKPTHVYYKDWANDVLTATDEDRNGPRSHAHQTVSTQALWDDRLYWAGSETASISTGDNGYLEGALAAAERVVKQIT
jgi:monoamine oxidase